MTLCSALTWHLPASLYAPLAVQMRCGQGTHTFVTVAMVRYSQSADLWSFGIVLLELARGRVPHAQASFTALVMSTVHDPAPSLELHAKRKFSPVRLTPRPLSGCVLTQTGVICTSGAGSQLEV